MAADGFNAKFIMFGINKPRTVLWHRVSVDFVVHFISALSSLWNWSHGLVPQRGNTQEVATKTGNCGQRSGILSVLHPVPSDWKTWSRLLQSAANRISLFFLCSYIPCWSQLWSPLTSIIYCEEYDMEEMCSSSNLPHPAALGCEPFSHTI